MEKVREAFAKTGQFISATLQNRYVFWVLVPLLLYVILAPGIIFNLPPADDCNGNKQLLGRATTSSNSVAVAGVVSVVAWLAVVYMGERAGIPKPWQGWAEPKL